MKCSTSRASITGVSETHPRNYSVRYLPLIVSLILSGCFPYRFVDRPGISGCVIDHRTKQPIGNATVTAHFRQAPVSASSAPDGTFTIPPKYSWGIFIIPMDPYGENTEIDFTQPGYMPARKEVIWNMASQPNRELGQILMDRRRPPERTTP